MGKCMARWEDPLRGLSTSAVGPYSCGRRPAHPGVHAWDGNGAVALWTKDGRLLLSIQQLKEGGSPLGVPLHEQPDEDLAAAEQAALEALAI